MKIYYQGIIGSYSFIASDDISKKLSTKIQNENIIGLQSFGQVWKNISNEDDSIAVLPIENSYAGSIHENVYNFLDYDCEIIGEYDLKIDHCLLSLEKNISDIHQVYSHWQALSQCQNFLEKCNLQAIKYEDTALSAKYIASNNIKNTGAIASKTSGQLYGLNIIAENIQDQKGNTTKFIIIKNKRSNCKYKDKSNKISILFSAKDIPASLYKCLGAFATNGINLTKIESMSNKSDPFSYMFFISFKGKLSDSNVKFAIDELPFWTNSLKILGEY